MYQGSYMTGIPFAVCPICGKSHVCYKNDRHWVCADCGFDLFNNVASAVGLIICARDTGRILFEKRAKEPRKGFLALPGGFTDPDESLEQAAVRECTEETGLVPLRVQYLASFPNTYMYKDVVYKTCDCFFVAELAEAENENLLLSSLKPQQEEVLGFCMQAVFSAAELEALPLAFKSAHNALSAWIRKGL